MDGNWGFVRWRGSHPNIFEGKYQANLEFLEGLGKVFKLKLSMGEVWVFSGTLPPPPFLTFISRFFL